VSKVARVSYLSYASAGSAAHVAFRQGLHELGYVEGRNIAFEDRFADGRADRLPALAAELVRLKMDVIAAAGTQAVQAAKDATKTIPIVMISGGDAVRSGFVVSLARPGGNITGVVLLSSDLMAKRLDLLKQLVPAVSRFAILWDPTLGSNTERFTDLQGTAHSLNVRLQFVEARQPSDYDGAFAAMVKARAGAVVIQGSAIFLRDARQIVDLAAKHRLPAAYISRENAIAGGLMAYGPNLSELARLAAVYVDKILKGAKPAELPVQQPTKFELLLNLKTAKALGLSIPPALRMRADELID
jgi:putative ABC transport system substrate-binding protein